MSETSRIAALKAAVEFRTAAMTLDQVLEMAQTFDNYLATGELPKPPGKTLSERMRGTLRMGAKDEKGKAA